MALKIVTGLIIILLFLGLCAERKEIGQPNGGNKIGENCARFVCDGDMMPVAGMDAGVGFATCDGQEVASINCSEDKELNMELLDSHNMFSLCCVSAEGYLPLLPCEECIDGTVCHEKNNDSEECLCLPDEGEHFICSLFRRMTCAEACGQVGYEYGHCGDLVVNNDSTVSACAGGEYPFFSGLSNAIIVTDCIGNGTQEEQGQNACCCRGEPETSKTCPAPNKSAAPAGCIEYPGYLMNPQTGECCWYQVTCLGPQDWEAYFTKDECLAA